MTPEEYVAAGIKILEEHVRRLPVENLPDKRT